MKQSGMPSTLIDTFISYDIAQLNGETEMFTDIVKAVLGKSAITVEKFAKDYAYKFK